MSEIDVSTMSDKEREIYLRRVLMETAVHSEQVEQAKKEGKKLVYGENYGMISLKEFINMRPEYSKYVDPSIWDKSPEEAGIYIAPFGDGKFIPIENGIIAGRSENGGFEPSDQLVDEMAKVPMQQMLLLTHSGIINEQYLEKYRDNFEKKSLKSNRIPDSFEEYLKMATSGEHMVTEEEFLNGIELTDEDRAKLEEYKKEIGYDAEEKEGEELEEELEGEERERRPEEEGEEREEEERDPEEKTEEKVAEEAVENDLSVEDISKDIDKYQDLDMEKLYEERAKILAESVLSRYGIPAESREQLVELFAANPDLDINSLKQAMEITITSVDREDRGFALRFASKDASLSDRVVVFDGNKTIDERKNDDEISAKMDEEYEKAPVEVLSGPSQVLVYTDYSGNTITAPLKKKNMDDLTRSEGEKVIREFEELLAREKNLVANRASMTPENFSRAMTAMSIMRLKVIGENGLNVPEIHDEIKADKEISQHIERKIDARKSAEEEQKAQEQNTQGEDKEDDDWVRGPYDPRHGM